MRLKAEGIWNGVDNDTWPLLGRFIGELLVSWIRDPE